MNPDNDMEDRKRISDITFFKSAMDTKIRCKIDGNWQMEENLSQKDKKRYEEVKLSGNKPEMEKLKWEMAEKYFKEQLEEIKKRTWKG